MQTIDTVNSTILLAIELSASTWLVAARVPGLEKPHLHRIDGGDTAALLALISSLRARAARGLDATIGVRYAQESSWREDNRRVSNVDQVSRVAALAMKRGKSVDFTGYWQRDVQ
jgi:hypothetical protein